MVKKIISKKKNECTENKIDSFFFFHSENESYPIEPRLKTLFENDQIQNFLQRHGLVKKELCLSNSNICSVLI